MEKLEVSKRYWETRLPQRWYSSKKYGSAEYWADITRLRYTRFFPYFPKVNEFRLHRGHKVLEIGVGVGTDLLQYAQHGAHCTGVDLTASAIQTTKKRFKMAGLPVVLKRANAEHLPFDKNTFDIVASIGVLHHVPNMQKSIDEVHRVLKPGSKAIIWLYGKDWKYYFWFPFYGLLKGHAPKENLDQLMHRYMEVEGHVPIVRMFRKKDLPLYFKKFSKVEYINKGGYGTSLGNKFQRTNRIFCAILNFLFPYNAWIVKAVK